MPIYNFLPFVENDGDFLIDNESGIVFSLIVFEGCPTTTSTVGAGAKPSA